MGVNGFVATASAGKPIRTVLVGLVPEISGVSARRAADSSYLQIIDTMMLDDSREPEEKIDALLSMQPDLLMISGGTNDGAADSLREMIDLIGMTAKLTTRSLRPSVLYAGNEDLRAEVRESLREEAGMRLLIAENVRPDLDTENLASAQARLSQLYNDQKGKSTRGFSEIGAWTDTGVMPTAHAVGRLTQLLAGMDKTDMLTIDLGSSSTAVAAVRDGDYTLNAFGTLGMGHSAKAAMQTLRPQVLDRWLTSEPAPDVIENYILNKDIYPHRVPVSASELELEYSLAREVIRRAVLGARSTWRGVRRRGLLPPFDTILVSGSTVSRAPTDGWAAMIMLDALLPIGITRLMTDPFGLAPILGSAAALNPAMLIHVMKEQPFIELGTAVSLGGRARDGETAVTGTMRPAGGETESFEAPAGTITMIPLPPNVETEVTLQPRRMNIAGVRGKVTRTVKGGSLGLIIDARGRPWRIPRAVEARRAQVKGWIEVVTK